MIKFDKMSAEELSDITKRIIGTGLLALVTVSLAGLASLLRTSYKELSEQNQKLEDYFIEEQQLIDSISENTNRISNLKLVDTMELLSQEELVVVLGDCARESGVSIIGLDSANADIDDAITKYNFVFEIKGTTGQIADTLAGIDAHNLHYAINEMSLRQAGDYLWLQRNFEEQITWWDLSNVTTAGGLQSRTSITSEDIIGDATMTLYLNLDFIFVTDAESEDAISNVNEIDVISESESLGSAVTAKG